MNYFVVCLTILLSLGVNAQDGPRNLSWPASVGVLSSLVAAEICRGQIN